MLTCFHFVLFDNVSPAVMFLNDMIENKSILHKNCHSIVCLVNELAFRRECLLVIYSTLFACQ